MIVKAVFVLVGLISGWVAWSVQQFEAKIDAVHRESIAVAADLQSFKAWHGDTMIRRDYLDARFETLEKQINMMLNNQERMLLSYNRKRGGVQE